MIARCWIAVAAGIALGFLFIIAVLPAVQPAPCDPHSALPWLRCERSAR